MSIASHIKARLAALAMPVTRDTILTLAIDDHNVVCMTEGMLDEWWRSLDPADKAELYDIHLGPPAAQQAVDLSEELAAIQSRSDSALPQTDSPSGLLGLNAAAANAFIRRPLHNGRCALPSEVIQ